MIPLLRKINAKGVPSTKCKMQWMCKYSKKALKSEFGEVIVDLEKVPREISLDLDEDRVELLKQKLRSIGYPLVDDELSIGQNINAKAKSFVSCAIGKLDN